MAVPSWRTLLQIGYACRVLDSNLCFLKHIFSKLGVEKRAQAAARAQSLGLIVQ
jgi:hypothetical protein